VWAGRKCSLVTDRLNVWTTYLEFRIVNLLNAEISLGLFSSMHCRCSSLFREILERSERVGRTLTTNGSRVLISNFCSGHHEQRWTDWFYFVSQQISHTSVDGIKVYWWMIWLFCALVDTAYIAAKLHESAMLTGSPVISCQTTAWLATIHAR